jgi:hypothetical protein
MARDAGRNIKAAGKSSQRVHSYHLVQGVTISTDASLPWCGKKLLKRDIIKGHNLGPPSLTGSLTDLVLVFFSLYHGLSLSIQITLQC